MSINTPPNPNVATFNNLYWVSADTSLTTADGDKRYLKFPVAQGQENLKAIVVDGIANFNNDIIQIGATNNIVQDQTTNTDQNSLKASQIYGDLSLRKPTSAVGGGLRLYDVVAGINSSQIYTTGSQMALVNLNPSGSTTITTTDGAGVQSQVLQVNSTSTNINNFANIVKPLNMTGSTAVDRQIVNCYYQLQDISSFANTGQIYSNSGIFTYDNDTTISGTHTFATNNSSGVQTIPLSFNSANMTITSNIIQESGSQLLQIPASSLYSTTDNVLNGTEIRTNYGQSQNTSFRISDAGSLKGIFFLPYATDNVYDNIVQAGDAVITSTGASLVLTNSSSNNNTTNGIRLDNTQVLVGFGDGNDIPTNNISFTQSATTIGGVAPDCAASSALATSDNSTKLPSTAWVRSYVTSVVPVAPVTFTSTASTTGYNSGGNYTYWYFTSFPSWTAFSWVFNTPLASRTFLGKNNLGSSPPLNVGTIGSNGSFILMTGTGVYQGYSATSSTMITYCNGYQQQYTIGTSANAAILSVVNCIGATAGSPIFQSNQLTENDGTCPPTAYGLSGYIILQVLNGNYTGLGTPTLKFTQLIA